MQGTVDLLTLGIILNVELESHLLPWPLQGVFVKQVFSHRAVCLRSSDAAQTANVVAQLLDGFMAVGEEVLLQEVTQLQKK